MAPRRPIILFRLKVSSLYPRQFLVAICLLMMIKYVTIYGAAAPWDEKAADDISSVELGSQLPTRRRLLVVNSTQSLFEDSEALLRIKAAITKDPYNSTYWWKRQGKRQRLNACRPWPGITCTKGRVTAIDLFNKSLEGTLTQDLGSLSNLKVLNLSNNFFSGTIPPEIMSASMLESIDLGSNDLSGSLPSSFGDLANLTTLVVASNQLSGPIPTSYGNLRRLVTLNMSTNYLSGSIPQELTSCKKLQEVDLSNNEFHGSIPFQSLANLTVLHLQNNLLEDYFGTNITSCPQLRDLDLANNRLNGNIPDSLGDLTLLQRIDLSSNKFTGSLPDSVGSCSNLLELDLSANTLSGGFPPTLASLPALVSLNVSYNVFSGSLPIISNLSNLRVFDASFNELTGSVPANFVSFQSLNFLNVSSNLLKGEVPDFSVHLDVNDRSFLNNSLCGRVLNIACHSSTSAKKIFSITVGCSVALLAVAAAMYIICSKARKRKGGRDSATVSAELDLKVTPEEILHATHDFDEGNVLGVGSKSTVYRGVLLDETTVAVKRFGIRGGELSENAGKLLADNFETLGHIRHWSLVKVLGYCCSPDIKAIVMEYMPNGTLENLLYPQLDVELVREFNWTLRLNTAIQVAQGLKFLHHESQVTFGSRPIVHGDLKPSNILFNTFMEARVADFGVARGLGIGASSATPATISNNYMAPEVATTGWTIKGDVYSFGIVVLEMISGRSPLSLELGQTLPQWVRGTLSNSKVLLNVLDPILMADVRIHQQKMAMVLGVALLCTRDDPQERPLISEVLKMLNHIKSRPLDGKRRSSRKFRQSSDTLIRGESIRQEVAVPLTPVPPVKTPSASMPTERTPGIQSLPHTPSLSDWTPSIRSR